ncbi:hypothetical protein H4R20_003162, partial [Coemansia guatemalensis]
LKELQARAADADYVATAYPGCHVLVQFASFNSTPEDCKEICFTGPQYYHETCLIYCRNCLANAKEEVTGTVDYAFYLPELPASGQDDTTALLDPIELEHGQVLSVAQAEEFLSLVGKHLKLVQFTSSKTEAGNLQYHAQLAVSLLLCYFYQEHKSDNAMVPLHLKLHV